jgi:hypothetical protein
MGDNFEQCIIDADTEDAIEALEDVLPEDDFDGDGINNLDEFLDGTDPTIPDITQLEGDVNGDCIVNMADMSVVSINWGQVGENIADVNGDQIVNMADLSIISSNWGSTCQQ